MFCHPFDARTTTARDDNTGAGLRKPVASGDAITGAFADAARVREAQLAQRFRSTGRVEAD